MTLTTTAQSTATTSKSNGLISQWVSSVVNCESKSEQNAAILQACLGPPQANAAESFPPSPTQRNLELEGHFTHVVVFKINDKVFIESITIYERINTDSCITEIEALETKDSKEQVWFSIWKKGQPCEGAVPGAQKYTPQISKTPFRTDTLRITVVGTLRIIDAIEVTGYPTQDGFIETKDPLAEYGQLARDLRSLIMDECLADVHFEVEGKRIAAHRAILSFRSDYFCAMLGSKSPFTEKRSSSIYIPNVRYEVFVQVLNYLYTGHLDKSAGNGEIPHYIVLDLMRTADLMNLSGLEHVCLFDLSETINATNVIKIYKEAHDKLPVLDKVVELCHDVISANFATVVKTEDYCSLEQELMLKIINHVVPMFGRLTSHDIQPPPSPQRANLDELDDDDDEDDDLDIELPRPPLP